MKKHILILLVFAFTLNWALTPRAAAQLKSARSEARTLSGVVSDNQGTMAGAAVYLQNKSQRIIVGATTGIQGEYLISIPSYDDATDITIVVSFVGYKTQRVPYTGQKTFNVRLQEDSRSISTVSVTAKASRRDNMGVSRENLGTATEYIDVTEYENMSVNSIEDLLQGKMANLDILAASGDPGTSSTIRIRGSASLNASNEPLIVIDGIPQDTQVDSDFNFGDAAVDDFGAMVNISPNDIQSIEVLKDAAATALWGPKAANGVLLITTKQGGVHKPRFSLSQKMNYTFQPKAISMLNGKQYSTLMQDAMWNMIKDGGFQPGNVNQLLGQRDILYDRSYEYFKEFNCDTDWLDLISKNSLNSTTDFSMDGGGEKAAYRFSLGYEDQDGTTRGTGYTRITTRLNLTIKFSSKFRVDSRFSYSEAGREQSFGNSIDELNISELGAENDAARNQMLDGVSEALRSPIRYIAMRKMPNMSPWVLDAYGNPTSEYFVQPESSIQPNLPNSLALVEQSMNQTKIRTVGASFQTNYTFFKGFVVSGAISFSMSTIRNNQFLPSSVLNLKWANPQYNMGIEALANKSHTYGEWRMTYNTRFAEKHGMLFSAASQFETSNNNSYSISTSGNGAKQVSSPSSEGKIRSLASMPSIRRTVSFTGSLNYNYSNLFSLTSSARLNANSNTGVRNRWNKPRPSFSAVWKMHNQDFMKSTKQWLNEFRIRGSWGRSERTPDSNYTLGTFSYETSYMDMIAMKPNQMQLDALRPEVVEQYDAGIDASLFDNKININFDYYHKRTTDLLQNHIGIQSTTGYGSLRWYNSGSVLNHGWELMFNFNDIVKAGEWKFSLVNVNISRNINKIISLPPTMASEQYSLGNSNYPRKIIAGKPIGSIYGFISEGVYQNEDETLARDAQGNLIRDIEGKPVPIRIGSTWRQRPGDAKYSDLNYDGVIDEHDMVYLGNSFPTVTGGATFRVTWKRWMLRASLHFRLGQSIVNMVKHNTERMSNGDNQASTTLNRWRYEGDRTEIPRALWGTNYNSLGSSRFIEDGSFLKIKDITINYKFDEKLTRKIGISRANAFITTYNIFTFTKYSGQDPEIGIGNGPLALAVDNNRTPPSRRIAIGISFDF